MPLPVLDRMSPNRVVSPCLSPTILIVDDEPLIIEMLTASLERRGYHIETAPNGAVALKMLRERGAFMDMVLSDLAMPVLNGVELAIAFSREAPHIPVLLATGSDTHLKDVDYPENVVEVIQKPYRTSALDERLQALLNPPRNNSL